MKSLRLIRWSGSVLSQRTRPCSIQFQCQYRPLLPQVSRAQSTATAVQHQYDDTPSTGTRAEDSEYDADASIPTSGKEIAEASKSRLPRRPFQRKTSPTESARLAALHARLTLPPRLPLTTFARCLIDPSAKPQPNQNNASLSVLGNDLLGYFASEAIICRYPRLPQEVYVSAVTAHVGTKTLLAISREWGVEHAAAPGPEVDPGFLQFSRLIAGNASVDGTGTQFRELEGPADQVQKLRGWQRGVTSQDLDNKSSRETAATDASAGSRSRTPSEPPPKTLEEASAGFVRALMGALYLHTGLRQTKAFFNAHFLSRHLDVSSLFQFQQATRDLARLCARESFDPPLARLLSETGRKSRHPVFVVGIFSGREKLGEGSGGSLDEARIRAAIAALKGWYLYSPLKVRVPSEAVGKSGETWEPVMIDGGEVVV